MTDEWAEPACVGQWELFDSTYWKAHLKARALCATCPLKACKPALQVILSDPLHSAMLEGTWDGKLYHQNGNRRRKVGAPPTPLEMRRAAK